MAPARELRTIGSMFHSGPLERQRQRRARMTGIGATSSTWSPPAGGVDGETTDAALALQNYLDGLASGTPSMHTYDAQVAAFQASWNGDPAVAGNASARLDVDGSYGPNTQAALDSVTGVAQAVNAGAAPAIDPGAGGGGGGGLPPLNLTTPNTQGSPIGVIVLFSAIAFAGWAIFFRNKKKRGAAGGTTIDVKSNPRRRRSGGRRSSALLAGA
jgi:hypothetical protein